MTETTPRKRGPKPKGARPQTLRERVAASEAKAKAAGGARMSGMLTPQAVQALESLLMAGYATSKASAINRALIDMQAHLQAKIKAASGA